MFTPTQLQFHRTIEKTNPHQRLTSTIENVPKSIEWDAEDAGETEPAACRGHDHVVYGIIARKNTMRLDLWTRDMTRLTRMENLFPRDGLITMGRYP